MKKLIKNYIESYWWYFLLQAVIAIAFGVFALTTPIRVLGTIVFVAAGALVLMGVVGILRMVHDWTRRPHRRWGDSLVIALVELAVGGYFLFNIDAGFQVSAIVFGIAVLVRGAFDLVVALTNLKDPIDRFFWIVAGMAGVVLGLVILNHPGEASITMVWLLGLYILIFGVSNLFYAIHIRSKLNSTSISRATSAKKTVKKTVKRSTVSKKSTKK
ncbi:MAG: DUF308 domain-containing protein [Candidatus Nomurabacteria bacterium]|jgi:uncharacterized membrane protein HdeD (DUF308 family)|nr:DUF308 domain-containing protein [Candidatus Nomurabacteria bacterium]